MEAPTVCVNHSRRETYVRCGKCGDPLCPACMVQTPVGVRCKPCANIKRLPQYEVGLMLLIRSVPAGLIASIAAWLVVSVIPYLRFFLAILVGVAVGEVMSRLARRRSNRILEVAAVVDVVAGLLVVTSLPSLGGFQQAINALAFAPGTVIWLLVPAAIASFVAVVKLR